MSVNEIIAAVELLHQSQHIIAFTGAGISTASGIPDFRTPDSGFWNHADPMAVASLRSFQHDPKVFYEWVRPLAEIFMHLQPNHAHLSLAELEKLNKLDSIITQNIDMLHTSAGNSTIYEIHGHFREATCIQCFQKFDGRQIIQRFLDQGEVPTCKCGGAIKPDIILFGEMLPYKPLQQAKAAVRQADLLIVIGTSLEVAPASDIPWLAYRNGVKIIIINQEPTEMDCVAQVVVNDWAETVLPEIVSTYRKLYAS